MPGKARSASIVVGHVAAVALDHRPCRVVEVARPARVAQALPVPQHVAERRRRARRGVGYRVAERRPLRDDPARLGLLQHHLGDEDAPRIAGRPPRQVAQPRPPHASTAPGSTTVSAPHRPGCQPVAPSGAGGRCSSVCVLPSSPSPAPGWRARPESASHSTSHCTHVLPLAALAEAASATRRRRRPAPRRARCRRRRPGHTRDRLGPAATRRPTCGTSMRDAVLIGPSFDQPRDPVAVEVLPRRQLDPRRATSSPTRSRTARRRRGEPGSRARPAAARRSWPRRRAPSGRRGRPRSGTRR